jgi:hypothetical protein
MLRRMLTVGALAGAVVAGTAAGPARAADTTGPCSIVGPSLTPDVSIFLVRGDLQSAATTALGSQLNMVWASSGNADVGLSSGPLDAAAARTAILDQLRTKYTDDQLAPLGNALQIIPQLYSAAEIADVLNAGAAAFQSAGYTFTTAFPACVNGAWRAGFQVWTHDIDWTQDQMDAARAVVAQWGDEAVVTFLKSLPVADAGIGSPVPPTPVPPATKAPVAKAPRVGDYVSLARASRCVRGKAITVKARKSATLKSLLVNARGKHTTLTAGKSMRVKLAKRTKVKLTVTLASGSSASQTYTFSRCAA